MGKKLEYTPNTIIKHALRQIWLRSRERGKAIKNHGGCCASCGAKQSVAKGREVKLEVHHKNHVTNWQRIYDVIREELLCDPEHLVPMCKACHLELHENESVQSPAQAD